MPRPLATATLALVVALGAGAGAGARAEPIGWDAPGLAAPATITVEVAGAGADGVLAPEYSGYGRNISPAVGWRGAPPRTRTFALLIEDPDAGSPPPVVHWLAWNIPAGVAALPRATRNAPELERPAGVRQGANSHGGTGYTGPHPPVGDPAHHYHVQVYALDRKLGLKGGADRAALLRALAGHVLARGETVVLFAEAAPKR